MHQREAAFKAPVIVFIVDNTKSPGWNFVSENSSELEENEGEDDEEKESRVVV